MTYVRKEELAEGIVLYQGDCLEVLPTLGRFDAVVTDPPYGIASVWTKGGQKHGWQNANRQMEKRNAWDDKPIGPEAIAIICGAADEAIIWGGNYFQLPPSRCWLVWNKPERGFSLAEAELAWTNKDALVRVIDAPRSDVGREHPTQKPLTVMRWSVEKTKGSVVDPFMGSGTTGVACAKLGRKFTGIEIDPGYFDIAVRRIAAALKEPDLFVEPPKPAHQLSILDGDAA